MRYLLVFGKVWEVIDTQESNKVISSGSREEMRALCKSVNEGEEYAKSIEDEELQIAYG
jgi:hypothetical protein